MKSEKTKMFKLRQSITSIISLFLFFNFFILTGCQRNIFESSTVAPAALRDVPALRLNFRYEADVPAPTDPPKNAGTEEKNAAVQSDFDAARQTDILFQTITSPNKQRILAVYQRLGDSEYTYRLDMYTGDGKFLRRISPDTMTVDFPDIIVWSPDSTNVAFVAIVREGGLNSMMPLPSPSPANANTAKNTAANKETNSNANTNTANTGNTENTDTNTAATPVQPVGESPANVLTFRTEQIYLCSSEGTDLKAITQNEGLIYYYFVWSPDGSMLAALAASYKEWNYLKFQADKRNEIFVPLGRPRIVEKNGRERRLDDNLTPVHPAWSPDSAKVAVAFDKQIRIYDAIGDNPTQAAIPLRNQLLLSSQAFDQAKNRESQTTQDNANAETNANINPSQPAATLPDESTLVSFQPIINMEWTADNILYFQTGYVKEFKTGDGARSSLRWHRLILSPQAVAIGNRESK